MNDDIAHNILRAVLLLVKKMDEINITLKNVNESLANMPSHKQEETN